MAVTSPYFHNGSVADLKDAVRVMVRTQLGMSIGGTPPVTVIDATAGGATSIVVQQNGSISESDVNALVTVAPKVRVENGRAPGVASP